MICVRSSGYPGYPYPGGNAYPATGGPAHYSSQTPVTTVGELACLPLAQIYSYTISYTIILKIAVILQ